MAGTTSKETRPLSPHLQVWRWHATMAASTMHRLTGISLFGGSFLLAVWVIALGAGEDAYGVVDIVIQSVIGQTLLFLFTMAVLFHLVNGIRYLFWDGPGVGFDPKTASSVSIMNFTIAILGACAIWAIVLVKGA